MPMEQEIAKLEFQSAERFDIVIFETYLDEGVAARPAAGHSYRNPVVRCHCIANLGLQSVGMMRLRQDPEFERIMKKCDGNADVRKE